MKDRSNPLHIVLYSYSKIGECDVPYDHLTDQKSNSVYVEMRDVNNKERVIGMLHIDILFIYSRIELYKNMITDLLTEEKSLEKASAEKKRNLDVLQLPFKPIAGFEIASKVSTGRNIYINPYTHEDDPMRGI